MEKTLEEAPQNTRVFKVIEYNMNKIKAIPEACSASSTPVQSGRSIPVQGVPESLPPRDAPQDAASLASDLAHITL